jgi:fructan beta-fructosidase
LHTPTNLFRDRVRIDQLPRRLAGMAVLLWLAVPGLGAESSAIKVAHRYLNLPIARDAKMQTLRIEEPGKEPREFAAQLADGPVDYWTFIDVSEFKGQTITLSGSATQGELARINQSDKFQGQDTLYKEVNRPQFHFTPMRGWNNDANGPIFYHGQYHLFWQAFPFGNKPDGDYMYWGHATSKDLVHWQELKPALMADKLGGVWSGTAFVDRNNDAGLGKDALVLIYTAQSGVTHKQVQCLAYSTDDGATFKRYAGNPVLDTNDEVGSNDTRDPKVFWYEPTKKWVLVLFEKDGMSIFNSTDLKTWARQSHFKGLWECPDFFELSVDGDANHKKWVLHGGSATYYIGSFDGKTFAPETPALRYAEGKNAHGDDALYAAESFVDLPDGRRVQMGWGRIEQPGMPFNQMLLFPTEFKLATTKDGVRMITTPVDEIECLHAKAHTWTSINTADASKDIAGLGAVPLHVKMQVALDRDDELQILYQGKTLATIKGDELNDGKEPGKGSIQILIDKCVAEIFVAGAPLYYPVEIPCSGSGGLEFKTQKASSRIERLAAYEMKSMWEAPSTAGQPLQADAVDDLKSVLHQLNVASANFRSTAANVEFDTVTTDPIPDTDVQKGLVYYQRKDGGVRMGVHLNQHNGRPSAKEYTFMGGEFKLFEAGSNQVTTYAKAGKAQAYLMTGMGASGADLQAKWDIVYLGAETMAGIKTAKLELVAKDLDVRKLLPRLTIWVDPDHAVSLKQIFALGPTNSYVALYSNFKFNLSLPEDAFTFKTDRNTVQRTQ